jgi:hypothetical protein
LFFFFLALVLVLARRTWFVSSVTKGILIFNHVT